MVLPSSHRIPRVLWYSGSQQLLSFFAYRTFTSFGLPSQVVQLNSISFMLVLNPYRVAPIGLGSFPFARRYLENRLFFLFLRVLRCFSSPGLPSHHYFIHDVILNAIQWVSPFGYLRIIGYLRLPEAFRSLLRPSSASGAKAFSVRPLYLDLSFLLWRNCLRSFSLRIQFLFYIVQFSRFSGYGTHLL